MRRSWRRRKGWPGGRLLSGAARDGGQHQRKSGGGDGRAAAHVKVLKDMDSGFGSHYPNPPSPRRKEITFQRSACRPRSSTLRKGSLQRTVRWAWSLSFRWTQSTVKSRRFSWALRMNSPRSAGPRGLRRDRLRLEDLDVGRDPFDRPALLQQIEQTPLAVHVVVGQVELGHPGRGEREVVLVSVTFNQLVFGDPVDLPRDQVEVAGLHGAQGALPEFQDPAC